MNVSALPNDSIVKTCILSGSGKWDDLGGDQEVNLYVVTDGAPGSCESGSYGLMELVGHSKPYGLYWVLGDPDSGMGVWLKRQ